jgi:hypothetical protein
VKRVLLAGSFLLFFLAGCVVPPEREPLRLLPDDRAPPPYAELLTRARAQATIATEAYYTDRWMDLEDAARGLEQTAHFLAKVSDVPPTQKVALPKVSEELAKEAVLLRDAAREKDVKKVQDRLEHIQPLVRELRTDK